MDAAKIQLASVLYGPEASFVAYYANGWLSVDRPRDRLA